MPEPTRAAPRQITGDDIIAEVLRNFELGFFPIRYTTLVPCVFHVYLQPEDFDQMRPVAAQVDIETRRALSERTAELNRAEPTLAERLGIKAKPAHRTEYKALSDWTIEFHADAEGELQRGDIEIYSELGEAPREDYGVGMMTRRITRRAADGTSSTRSEAVPLAPTRPVSATPPTSRHGSPEPVSSPAPAPGEQTWAWIRYEDQSGRHEYAVTKDLVVIGRGGRSFWVDVKLNTLPDVSREHCRIRRDPATGAFYLKDMSQFGTNVNGSRVPSSVEMRDGTPYDKNIETTLPARAQISLADAVVLNFETVGAP